ncbi:exo-alpha-sialidase [Sphingomonas sp. ABOLF]|nr:exo-alpha-sialidase [Sphingomonas sp. ABOLF]
MAKISELPPVADPTGEETVVVLDGGETRRVKMDLLAGASLAPHVAVATAELQKIGDRADAAADRIVEARDLLPRAYDSNRVQAATLDPHGMVLSYIAGGQLHDASGLNLSQGVRDLAATAPRVYQIGGTGIPSSAVLDPYGMVLEAVVANAVPARPKLTLAAEKARVAHIPPSITFTPLFVTSADPTAARAVPGLSDFFRLPAGDGRLGEDHAFCEARHDKNLDGGYIGVAWAHRENGVWGPSTLLIGEPGADYHNPCCVYDHRRDEWHLLFGWNYATFNEDTEPSLATDPANAGRMYWAIFRQGAWRHPITGKALPIPFTRADAQEILQGRDATWRLFYPGPGKGKQLSNGALVMPGWVKLGTGGDGNTRSMVLRYDDYARTWSAGAPMPLPAGVSQTNEPTVEENDDGTIRLNCRSGTGYRVIGHSADLGRTWTRVATDSSYPTPQVAEALLRTSNPQDGLAGRGLYYNVASNEGRFDGTIRYTLDGFETYVASRKLFDTLVETVAVDYEGAPVPPVEVTHDTAYGCLWVTGPDRFGLLVELAVVRKDGTFSGAGYSGNAGGRYRVIVFVEFTLSWLLERA